MFLLFRMIFAFKFRLKLAETNNYMGSKGSEFPIIVPLKDADTYSFEKDKNSQQTYIVVENKDNQIFDIKGNGTKLIYWKHRNNGSNQQFILAVDVRGFYKLYVMSKCIAFSQANEDFEIMRCNDDDMNQSFEVEPITPFAFAESLLDPLFYNKYFGKNLLNNNIWEQIINE